MPKTIIFATILLTLTNCSSVQNAKPQLADVEATDARWIADLHRSNAAEAPLEIATTEVTAFRTWPGTYDDWLDAITTLDSDILQLNFADYRKHVAQLVFKGRIGVIGAAKLVRLSFTAHP